MNKIDLQPIYNIASQLKEMNNILERSISPMKDYIGVFVFDKDSVITVRIHASTQMDAVQEFKFYLGQEGFIPKENDIIRVRPIDTMTYI